MPVLSVSAAASPVPRPGETGGGCGAEGDRDFPLTARIRGGPDSYAAGGGYGIWYVDLTNTTSGTCTALHPVVVLADDQRALAPAQPRLEFYDGSTPRPVRLEATDEQELVGVFDADGFGGFTVGPGRTVSVKVRLAFTGDAVPNRITASAAVVRREGEDGRWVGETNAYRFAVGDGGSAVDPSPSPSFPSPFPLPSSSGESRGPGVGTGTDGAGDGGTGGTPGPEAGSSASGDADADAVGGSGPGFGDAGADAGGGPGSGDSGAGDSGAGDYASGSSSGAPSGAAPAFPFEEGSGQAGEAPGELAATGSAGLAVLAAGAVLLVVGGGIVARRRRPR